MAGGTHEHFAHDLGVEIATLARKASASARTSGDDFDLGRAFALYEVVSVIQQQAAAFGLELTDVGQADLDPERDLLVSRGDERS